MRGGTSASRGPGAVRPGPARRRAARMIGLELAFGDGAGRSRYYIVRFRRRPAGNSGQTTGVTLFKARNKQVNVLVRKPVRAALTGPH